MGRQTAVGEGKTLTRPDNNRRGGEGGGRDLVTAERPPGASGTLRLLRTPLPLVLLAAGVLPLLCLDSINHVTLSHETRICRLPRTTAQQIAEPRDPRGPACRACARPVPVLCVCGRQRGREPLRALTSRCAWGREARGCGSGREGWG